MSQTLLKLTLPVITIWIERVSFFLPYSGRHLVEWEQNIA